MVTYKISIARFAHPVRYSNIVSVNLLYAKNIDVAFLETIVRNLHTSSAFLENFISITMKG